MTSSAADRPSSDAAPSTTVKGRAAEDVACVYLTKLGYEILARNVHYGHAELDVVAMDGTTLCFIEVRSRAACAHGHPFETVTPRKQAKIVQAARAWLARDLTLQKKPPFCRFDVVGITGVVGDERVELIRGAFEARA